MRVSRLEVFGFKSFMDRLVLPLEGGVTGVVGPNGCGKSNIVDAIRWVLGETRASNLRGGVLEDVIFNGTDKLRPLGLAEVTLTLRAAQGSDLFSELCVLSREHELLSEFEGLEVESDESAQTLESPALEQPLESQGAEGAPSRVAWGQPEAERAAELLEASAPVLPRVPLRVIEGGLAAPSAPNYSSVPPAVLPADLSAQAHLVSAGEALPLTSEVAASGRSTVDREPPSFLQRFSWLKSLHEIQITRRLYRSGESEFFLNRVACRLKDLKELFRVIGMGARAYTIVAQGEVSRIISAKPEERRLILEEAAGVLGFREKIAAAQRRLEETTANILRLEDILKEVARQVQILKRQAGQARSREQLRARIQELESAVFSDRLGELSLTLTELQKQESLLKDDEGAALAYVDRVRAEEDAARNELLRIDVEGDSVRLRVDGLREELGRREQRRSSHTNRLGEIRAFSEALIAECRERDARSEVLRARHEELGGSIRMLEEQEQAVSTQLAARSSVSEVGLQEASARVAAARAELREQEERRRAVREELVGIERVVAEIREQMESMSPLSKLKETLGRTGSEIFVGLDSVPTALAEHLQVPREYATAAQAVLRERAGFIISSDPHEIGARFLRHAQARAVEGEGDLGSDFALGVLCAVPNTAVPNTAVPNTRESQPEDSAVGVSSESGAAAGVAVALEQWQGLPSLLSVVTVAEEARAVICSLLDSVFVAHNLDQAIEIFARLRRGGEPEPNVRVVTLAGEVLTAQSFVRISAKGGLFELRKRSEELEQSYRTQKALLHSLDESCAEALSLVEMAEGAQRKALEESQQLNLQVRELSNQQGALCGRLQAERRMGDQVASDILLIERQQSEARRKLAELEHEGESVQREMTALSDGVEETLRQDLDALVTHYQELEGKRRAGRDILSSSVERSHAARAELDGRRQRGSQLALELQKAELSLSALRERFESDYSMELRLVVEAGLQQRAALTLEQRADYQSEVAKLRARIGREGDVDPSSIARFEEENRRLEDLTAQKNDLQRAAETLGETIQRLTATSEAQFVRTFNAVRANFERLIPRLFGGGKGTLELIDPTKPLETGVDILVRPPGKKPKSIELLSGGEKALCATALIVAMFLEKPGPLCVMDEVDAPLDEANLTRFLGLVREMSTRTQFMIITHNKQSMSVADHLVGVTMQEPGASRIISVSLQEAYSQVA